MRAPTRPIPRRPSRRPLLRCVCTAVLPVILLLWSRPAIAQDRGIELGTRAGLSILMSGGDVISFAVPGGAPSPTSSLLGGASSIHMAFFPSERVMIEPQLNFSLLNVSNGSSETLTTLGLTGQVAYLLSDVQENGTYLGGNLALFRISNDDSTSDLALGGNAGYRWLVSESAVMRLEGSYRRWFDFEANEINVALIFGLLLD